MGIALIIASIWLGLGALSVPFFARLIKFADDKYDEDGLS